MNEKKTVVRLRFDGAKTDDSVDFMQWHRLIGKLSYKKFKLL